jgi:hypothetical protein
MQLLESPTFSAQSSQIFAGFATTPFRIPCRPSTFMGGLAAAYEIGKIAPRTKIVFISSHYTLGQAAGLDRLFGAAHFVQKSEMGKELIPTIKKLLRA